jgi:hypothetical protein
MFTKLEYTIFSFVFHTVILFVSAILSFIPFRGRPSIDWTFFCCIVGLITLSFIVQYPIMLVDNRCKKQECMADPEFLDDLFRDLVKDAEKLVEKKLRPGNDRYNAVANLVDDYVDVSKVLVEFLVWEEKHLERKKMADATEEEKGDVRRGEGYILQLKLALELRKQILLDSVDAVIEFSAGAGRLDAVMHMCDEFLWIERDSEHARKQGWWDAMKDNEKGNELECLREQSIMKVPEWYSCLDCLKARKGDGWVKWRVFDLRFGYKWVRYRNGEH